MEIVNFHDVTAINVDFVIICLEKIILARRTFLITMHMLSDLKEIRELLLTLFIFQTCCALNYLTE